MYLPHFNCLPSQITGFQVAKEMAQKISASSERKEKNFLLASEKRKSKNFY